MAVSKTERVSYAAAGFGDMLTHDLAHGIPGALEFFPAQRWEDVVARVAARAYPRQELCRVLEADAAARGAPEAALANIRLLADEHTYVVATGQQAGFLGGPLYTLHKALSAIKLAQELQTQAGGRARFVPLFWVAGDDHDLAEIDHADLLGDDGAIGRLRAPFAPGSAGRAACDVSLSSDPAQLDGVRATLFRCLKDDAVAERYLAAYRGCSLSDAFARLLYEWLGGLGLVVAQSSSLRVLAAPILRRELAEYDITSRLIHEAGLSLQQRGYKPGFPLPIRSAPHFFLISEPGRIRAHLEPAEDGARFGERSAAFAVRNEQPRAFTKQELADLLAAQPQRFSASAALRPVVQQHILPVVAAVLGPGEIAYWAQLEKVHEHFGVVWPMVVPRATLTLLDAHGEKALRKLGVNATAPAVFDGYEALRKLAMSADAASISLEARVNRVLAEFETLAREVLALDAGLKPMCDKARERITHELARVVEKTHASLGQREDAGEKRLRYLAALVRPKNSPQERVLNTAQFMARFPSLSQDLLNVIEPFARKHMIVTLR